MPRLLAVPMLLLSALASLPVAAQGVVAEDTSYGHEWLVEGQTYYKLSVAEDGLIEVTGADVEALGVAISQVRPGDFTVYRLGERIPVLEVSGSEERVGRDDAFVFRGRRNRAEFDRWLLAPGDEPLHPEASLFSDTVTYYLTFEPGPHPRYGTAEAVLQSAETARTFPTSTTTTWTAAFADPDANSTAARSTFSGAEGFTTAFGREVAVALPVPAAVAGTDVELSLRLTGSGTRTYSIALEAGGEIAFEGNLRGSSRLDVALTPFPLTDGAATVPVRLRQSGDDGRVALAQATATYERHGDLLGSPGVAMRLPAGGERKLALWNLRAGDTPTVALDDAELRALRVEETGDTSYVHLPNDAALDLAVGRPATSPPLTLWTFAGLPAEPAPPTALLVTSDALQQTDGPSDAIDRYVDYRSSDVGGGQRLVVLDVEDLYDWFGYGIPRHSQAVRNAVAYYTSRAPSLRYLYLVGKGRRYSRIRTREQLSSEANASAYVPTFGSPPSDALFSALPGTSLPRLNTARLPAESLAEVAAYLEKITAVESGLADAGPQEAAWRRRALHLSGGNTPDQQQRIRRSMAEAEAVLAATPLPADVTSFYRQSSEAVETSQLDEIFLEINRGVGLTTFFGHGSVGVLGFNIDNPSRYDNEGQTPVFLILGCLAGDVHLPGKGVAEGFLAQRGEGMSFVGANVTESYESDIRSILPTIYEHWGKPWEEGGTIGGVLGAALREVRRRSSSERQIAFVEQYQLIGDPMLRLYSPLGPDLTWESGSAAVDPPLANPSISEVTVSADLLNLGRRVDSASVRLVRTLPDGAEISTGRTVTDVGYRTQLRWTVPSLPSLPGEHRFRLEVDTADAIAETATAVAEENNVYADPRLSLSVVSDAARPVYPPPYALTDCPLTLAAASADPLAPLRAYRFEIAAADDFVDLLDSATVRRRGGVVEWSPGTLRAGQTYHWRIAPVEDGIALTEYEKSSFTCRATGAGPDLLALTDTMQLSRGASGDLRLSSDGWAFPRDVREFEFINVTRQGSSWPRLLVNGGLSEANYGNDVRAGVYAIVVDPVTVEPWINPAGGLYGSETPATWRDRRAFPFLTSDADHRAEVVTFLDSVVPDGHYVGFMTIQDETRGYVPEQWIDSSAQARSIVDVLSEQGALEIDRLVAGGKSLPYVFVYRKGEGPLYEELATDVTDTLRSPIALAGRWFTGAYVSPRLTPLDSLHEVRVVSDDVREPREVDFSLSLVDVGGEGDDTLGTADGLTLRISDTDLSAPHRDLRVVWRCTDTASRRPLAVQRIIIEGRPLPDLVWDMAANPEADRLDVEYGDTVALFGTIYNGSDRLVRDVRVDLAGADLVGGLALPDSLIVVGDVEPQGRAGTVVLARNLMTQDALPTVRSSILLGSDRDRDRDGGNNTVTRSLSLRTDDVRPLLEVDVDGRPLQNGQLVGNAPSFTLRIVDDSPFAEDEDGNSPNTWLVEHVAPGGERQVLSVEEGHLVPLSSEVDLREVSWKPNLADGVHLLHVQASDRAGNAAPRAMTVGFEVDGEYTLTHLIPVPNPVVDDVRFAYRLTGAQEVADYRIDVYTLTGQRVHTLTAEQLGPLQPGRSATDGAWDGRAASGEPLPRGTYLYRVSASRPDNGQPFVLRASEPGDTAREFGKLLLLR